MIELDGERFDLQELLRLNSLQGISITDESGRFYLRWDEFNSCTEARDVLDRGNEILRVMNGIAQLEIQNWDNVRVRGVARDEANGARTQFMFPEAIRGRSRVSGNATIIRVDATVDSSIHKSTLESFLGIAQKDAEIEKALRILGSGKPNWSTLYNIYEIIESRPRITHTIVTFPATIFR